jgi:triosephosphate isomerase (TIM)
MIFAGNWKMNPLSIEDTKILLDAYNQIPTNAEIILFPPSIFLPQAVEYCHNTTSRISFGAQQTSAYINGAYTGDISASMVRSAGAQYTLIGHSEVRAREQHNDIGAEFLCALEAGLQPIVCIGYQPNGEDQSLHIQRCKEQVEEVVTAIESLKIKPNALIVAYEPVWAIGSGTIPNNIDIEKIFQDVGAILSPLAIPVTLLYGGSINQENCSMLMSISGIGGFLVGGASLKPEAFTSILQTIAI